MRASLRRWSSDKLEDGLAHSKGKVGFGGGPLILFFRPTVLSQRFSAPDLIKCASIDRWTRMPRSIGGSNTSASSDHDPFLAAFILNIAESEFPEHTGELLQLRTSIKLQMGGKIRAWSDITASTAAARGPRLRAIRSSRDVLRYNSGKSTNLIGYRRDKGGLMLAV